jgi:hypothetical protein
MAILALVVSALAPDLGALAALADAVVRAVGGKFLAAQEAAAQAGLRLLWLEF